MGKKRWNPGSPDSWTVQPQESKQVLPKFANLLYDNWFKRAFGTEKWKRMLLLLLREIIPERDIQSIEYSPTEHINPFAAKADVRIDVECVSGDGTRFVVELQRANQVYFGNRILYYSTFAVQQQLAKGHTGFDFPASYIIALMNFDYHGEKSRSADIMPDEYMFRYALSNLRHPADILTDRLQIILIELPRISERYSSSWTRLQKFLYYLCHMPELDDIPEKEGDEMFMILHNSAKTDTFTPEEQTKYIDDMTTEQDIRNQIEYSRLVGHQEGLAEGELKKALEVARAMKGLGIAIDLIVESTGLTEEEVAKL